MFDFQTVHCVDQVLNVNDSVRRHTWSCSEEGCGSTCEGFMCNNFIVSVVNQREDAGLAANCGDAVEISVSVTGHALLDFEFFGISEIVILSQPTGTASFKSGMTNHLENDG